MYIIYAFVPFIVYVEPVVTHVVKVAGRVFGGL